MKKQFYKYLRKFANLKASKSGSVSSRVFIYHNVADGQVDVFRNQIIAIKENFDEIVNASDFVRLSQTNQFKTKKYACITFDDGFDDVYRNAKPILDALNVSATIFLNQALYHLTNSNKLGLEDFITIKFPRISQTHKNLKGLSAAQLKDLISDGYEIGGHTYSHRSVPQMQMAEFEIEITEQMIFLKNHFNYELKSFAYPYGRKKDIPDWGADSLKNCGYENGFSGISRDINRLMLINLYEFPRTSVSLDSSNRDFLNLLKGSSDILDKLTGQYV